jgi:hypothetical protein
MKTKPQFIRILGYSKARAKKEVYSYGCLHGKKNQRDFN